MSPAVPHEVEAFIEPWRGVAVLPGSTELATAQSFVLDLCAALGVPAPHHADDYQFERAITFTHGDGSTSPGRIDCYRRGAFVLEAKKLKPGSAAAGANGWIRCSTCWWCWARRASRPATGRATGAAADTPAIVWKEVRKAMPYQKLTSG